MKRLFFIILLVATKASFAQVGVNTTTPSADLDVNGTARIRNIPTGLASDKILTVDADGNVREINSELTIQILTLQKSTDQTIPAPNTIRRVTFDNTPLITNGGDLSWNGSDAFMCNENGMYNVSLQLGINNSANGTEYVIGVINNTNNWIGRAAFSLDSSRGYAVYTTTLLLSSGDTIGIGVVTTNTNGGTCSVQGVQTGSTGTGNITNFTVERKL